MKQRHIKFKYAHEDFSFFPDGIETTYTGVAQFSQDEDGEQLEIIELYVNGQKQSKIWGTGKQWNAFLDTLCEAARLGDEDYLQEQIFLPLDSVWHSLRPTPMRRNLDAIKEAMPGASGLVVATVSNARELEDFDFTTYELLDN